ncbi:hypothetical protein [Pseudarthrobacter oxydans]|uniref:hypothetical protein n=1 Tax=Pseudarthrobacter oxydans TaxID=1671 RepID=UPI00343655FE
MSTALTRGRSSPPRGNMLRRVSLCRILIIILYGLSGLLPLIGFGISYYKHRRRIRGERERQKHIEYIDNEFENRQGAATTPEEVSKAEHWRNEENAKKDANGKPYGLRSPVLFADDSIPRVKEQYIQLQSDMVFVGIAVVCGALASIWSMLLPPTS